MTISRQRAFPLFAAGLLYLTATGFVVAGCGIGGGAGGGGQTNPGTTAGIYTVTITGVSGGMTATGTVALTVQ